MNLKKERRYMMKLLAGITAVAVFSSSLYLPRNVETVYANETVKVSAEPEVRRPRVSRCSGNTRRIWIFK